VGAPSARPRPSSGRLRREATLAKSPHQPTVSQAHYPDTRASVGKVEVTAVTSPFSLTDLTGKQRRSPRSDCCASHPGKADSSKFSLGRNRKLRLARPQASASGGGLRLARPQDSASASASGGIAPSPDPGLGLRRSLRLARPWARTDRATGDTSSSYL
jgi:hypothetical protein